MILTKKLTCLANARTCAGIFFFWLILFACATPQTKQLMLQKPQDLPDQALISEVPFYPQEQFHCGPATLAMAMNFYGDTLSAEEIAKDVFTPNLKGSLQVEMKAAVRKRGMLAYELTPELVYLLAEVSVGHPVIVLQNLSIKWYPIWHYALVIGYNLKRNTLILHTGKNSNYEVAIGTFELTWQRANNWALVILPSDTLPNDRNLINVLQAAVDLEEVGQIEHANRAYQAIIKRWPESFVALMGVANTHLLLKQPEQATKSYLRAAELKPNESDIYNNLAYSLLAQSCYNAALNSVRCAIALQPSNLEYQSSLKEITAFDDKNDEKNCPIFKCSKQK